MSLSFLASDRKMSDTISFSKSYITEDSDKIRTGQKNFQSRTAFEIIDNTVVLQFDF